MLKKIGRIAIPKGMASYMLEELKPVFFHDRPLVQRKIDFKNETVKQFHEKIVSRVNKELGLIVPFQERESDYIRFRKVERHTDAWDTQMKYEKKWVPVVFLHVCVAGSCVVKTASTTLHVKRGDVFALNPNVNHEVTSSTVCVTFCGVTPRPVVKRLSELSH